MTVTWLPQVHICKEWPDGLSKLLNNMALTGGSGAETMERLLSRSDLNLDSRCWDWGMLLPAGATALLMRDTELTSLNLGHNQMQPSSIRGIALALETKYAPSRALLTRLPPAWTARG